MEKLYLWWGAAPHLSQILDLYHKFKFDLWRIHSDINLRQKQYTKPGIQIYSTYHIIWKSYFYTNNQYTSDIFKLPLQEKNIQNNPRVKSVIPITTNAHINGIVLNCPLCKHQRYCSPALGYVYDLGKT